MARGTQLQVLVRMLRAETGRTTSVAQGQNELPELHQVLYRVQEWLYDDWDWPFRSIHRDEALVAGGRYYSFDPDLDFEGALDAFVLYSSTWRNLRYGITPEHYNARDSDSDERNDPITHWQHYEGGQFEVWPIPTANNLQTLRFYGTEKLTKMVADASTALLDDSLIVLFAAAELLAAKPEQAKLKLDLAQRRYDKLKGKQNKVGVFVMGGGVPRGTEREIQGGYVNNALI